MKNRASSHLLIIFLIVGLQIAGYAAIHRAGLLRGYETSIIGGVRDLLMYVPLIAMVLWLSRAKRYAGKQAESWFAHVLGSVASGIVGCHSSGGKFRVVVAHIIAAPQEHIDK